ncbi:MAG: hypothetical protein H7Y13_03905 [Sphingobacteriaceae bacterium]|nr:hypothetical protein [Sphingobacteriaceae bacterium]
MEVLESSFSHRVEEPCPSCGSKERTIFLDFEEGFTAHELLETKEKLKGNKKPVREISEGEDYSFKAGKFMFKERVINRKNNTYLEKVQDPDTGEIIHYTNHSLKDHKGHGSAKFSTKSTL